SPLHNRALQPSPGLGIDPISSHKDSPMKATERFLTVTVAALIFVFVAAAAYSLWARGTPSLTAFQEYAGKTVASLQVGCAEREVDQFLREMDLLMTEWQDTVTLAESTPRLALSP